MARYTTIKAFSADTGYQKSFEKMMVVGNYRHYSPFVRDKILMTDDKKLVVMVLPLVISKVLAA